MNGLTGLRGLGSLVSSQASKSPNQVSGLWQWLKADVGVTTGGANLVDGWADQSGNGRNMAQATSDNQPTWIDGGSYNGLLPAISFLGNDFLSGGAIGPASGTNARCFIASICSITPTGSGYNHIVHYGTDQTGQAYGMTTRGYAPHTTTVGPGNHYWASGMADDVACPTTRAILTVYFDGTTDRLRINGSEVVSATPTINTVTNVHYKVGARVGTSDEYFVGRLGELAVFNLVPSLTDIEAIENYMIARWF